MMTSGAVARGILFAAAGISWSVHAAAWTGDAHVSIVRAAFRLSSAAESRVPLAYRDEFFQAVQYGDEQVDCRLHRGPNARHEASTEAARLFAELTSPSGNASSYAQAVAIGRFLHFVADNAVPNALAKGEAVDVRDFFANKDFILFRERTNIAGLFAEAMRREGSDAQWGDDAETGQVPIYRLAVNLTIDALLLLPPPPGAPDRDAKGPVIFVVNRIDNGFAATHSEFYNTTSYTYAGPVVYRSYSYGERNVGGDGVLKPDLLQRQAVQIVEWRRENVRGSQTVRILLFNNTATCAASIAVKAGSWSIPLPGVEIPPRGLRKVTLAAPPGVSGDSAFATSKPGACAWSASDGSSIPTDYRLVLDIAARPPKFEGKAERFVEPAPQRPKAHVR